MNEWLHLRARKSRVARRIVNRLQWIFTRLEAMALRLTGRSLGGRIANAPTLLLTTTGRRSGTARTTPLVYVRDGDDFLVVAAYGGSPWNPHWLANLRHESRATVEVGKAHIEVIAAELTGEDRDHLWPTMLEAIASLASAEARTDRTIPLIRLAPSPAADRDLSISSRRRARAVRLRQTGRGRDSFRAKRPG